MVPIQHPLLLYLSLEEHSTFLTYYSYSKTSHFKTISISVMSTTNTSLKTKGRKRDHNIYLGRLKGDCVHVAFDFNSLIPSFIHL